MSIQTLKIPIQSADVKPYIKQGDTIPKITLAFDAGIDLTAVGVSIKMQLYKGNQRVFSIENGSGITIINALTFEIDEVAKENNTFPEGSLIGDLEVTDTDGKRFTYFNVEYTIIKEFTR
jgi:hypothetical protein